jgi:hypothetical protein
MVHPMSGPTRGHPQGRQDTRHHTPLFQTHHKHPCWGTKFRRPIDKWDRHRKYTNAPLTGNRHDINTIPRHRWTVRSAPPGKPLPGGGGILLARDEGRGPVRNKCHQWVPPKPIFIYINKCYTSQGVPAFAHRTIRFPPTGVARSRPFQHRLGPRRHAPQPKTSPHNIQLPKPTAV